MTKFLWRSDMILPTFAILISSSIALAQSETKVSFDRDVRPILSNHCWKCHGPDANERKAGLRLDQPDAAKQPAESGERAIVPGKPGESELVKRILSNDPDERMSPASAMKPLSDAQKDILKRWVEQGAEFQQHWSFRTVQRPALPRVKDKSWLKTPIDHFILARLETEGLKPAPEADRLTLIRRATLDLTGLPPTLAEVDAFVNDADPQAYEKLVDRLLLSPHYGERMALEWLDAARFADTNGYHIDNGRDMTRWRKWVIDAFKRNLPFDQFTIQQLAGDLLPEPSDPIAARELKLASGFHRNHMITFEGGAIPQEYHTAYIVDRVNTTATVWLGLTIACTQCHDHKYDPLTQREFYQLYAFFHNLPENGLDGQKGNASPLVKVPTADEDAKLHDLAVKVSSLEKRLSAPESDLDTAQSQWERSNGKPSGERWLTLADAVVETHGVGDLSRSRQASRRRVRVRITRHARRRRDIEGRVRLSFDVRTAPARPHSRFGHNGERSTCVLSPSPHPPLSPSRDPLGHQASATSNRHIRCISPIVQAS